MEDVFALSASVDFDEATSARLALDRLPFLRLLADWPMHGLRTTPRLVPCVPSRAQ